jgi:hypothetical protein
MILTAGLGKIDETHNSRKEVCEGKPSRFLGCFTIRRRSRRFHILQAYFNTNKYGKKREGNENGTQDPRPKIDFRYCSVGSYRYPAGIQVSSDHKLRPVFFVAVPTDSVEKHEE